MAILKFKSGPFLGETMHLKPGLNRIGRNPANDFIIDDPSISSFHCEIQVADIAVAIKDLGSTNGTFINQKQISKGIIQKGDLVTLGGIDLQAQLDDVEIVVPELNIPEQPGAAFLEDGSQACFIHRNLAAVLRCTKCENWYCEECVRTLKKTNGQILYFCKDCSAPCVPLPRTNAPVKKNFFTRLQETLLIRRK